MAVLKEFNGTDWVAVGTADTSAPGTTGAVPEPTIETAGLFARVAVAGDAYELAEPVAATVQNYGRWMHAGAPDATSGSFDFTADLATSNGTAVRVDDDATWTGAPTSWGYAVPQVTEAGSYSIALRVAAVSYNTFGVAFYSDSGGAFSTAIPPAQEPLVTDGTGGFFGIYTATVHLPAGTHIDAAVPGDATALDLFIQRIA